MTNDLKTSQASNPIRIRVAKPSDADQLARIHQVCSAHQPGSFMHHLGVAFFRQYYRILLREPTSVILCAEDPSDGIVGIASGTIDATAETQALYVGRYRLLLGSLPELVRKPWLIKEVHKRKKLLQSMDQANSIIGGRARFSFWGYLPDHPSKGMAIRLLKTFLNVMEDLGHDSVWFENDTINVNAQKINLMLGAEIVTTCPMDDGRVRAIAVHRLQPERRRQIILKKR
ncbi:MAG: hypothetical protein MUD16_00715 [Desulfobacterales bacterium]|jgi:hypothetical protein|nr:hypothetical protein [Desulfobacterales bacterium]